MPEEIKNQGGIRITPRTEQKFVDDDSSDGESVVIGGVGSPIESSTVSVGSIEVQPESTEPGKPEGSVSELLSNDDIEALLAGMSHGVESAADGVEDLVGDRSGLVGEELAELNSSGAETAPIEGALEEANSAILGDLSDAREKFKDEFDRVSAETEAWVKAHSQEAEVKRPGVYDITPKPENIGERQGAVVSKWEGVDKSESGSINEHQQKMYWYTVYDNFPDGDIKNRADRRRRMWAESEGQGEDYTDPEQFRLQTGEALRQIINEMDQEYPVETLPGESSPKPEIRELEKGSSSEISLKNLEGEKKEEKIKMLQEFAKEYESRLNNEKHPDSFLIDAYCKKMIIDKLLENESLTRDELTGYLLFSFVYVEDDSIDIDGIIDNAWRVVSDYVKNEGRNTVAASFGGEVKGKQEGEAEDDIEIGELLEIPLRSEKNVGLFGRLGLEAKRIYTDLTFKSRGKSEINRGQKMLEKSEDQVHKLSKDLLKSEDRINKLNDQLADIDEMMAKMGGSMKPREIKAIEKSRLDLEQKIAKEKTAKETLAEKLKVEEANRVELQKNIEKITERLDKAIDKRLEPYKQKFTELEEKTESLKSEKEAYADMVSGFEVKLKDLKDQVASLNEMEMPAKAKKSFKAALDRKITDIESALKVSRYNLSKLEGNIIKINGRLNKEEARIGKWKGIRDDLKGRAEKKPTREIEDMTTEYTPPKERYESGQESEKETEFVPGDYIDKWNAISKNDGMTLDKTAIFRSAKAELTLPRIEGIIKTTRFKGLTERQLKNKIKEKTSLLRAQFGVH